MKLTKREIDVMRILWESEKALMVSEIVNREGGTVYSVQRVMQSLLKKGMVAVDGYAYSNKTLGRKFKPLVSSESIESEALQELTGSLINKSIATSHLLASLLPTDNSEDTLSELDRLEEMIKERKKQILKMEDSEHQTFED